MAGRWARTLAVLGLTLALGGSPAAAADPVAQQTDDFAKAPLLDRTFAGHLDPGRDGHFAYYRFFYPADGSTATVNVQMFPDDTVVLRNAGMKVFGPKPNKEYLVGGQQPGARPNISGNIISQDPNDRGIYTVQLYNYDWNVAIDFTIEVAGVTPPPATPTAAAGVAPSGPTNTTGDTAQPISGKHEGVLDAGGRDFRYFSFEYPGDESVATINMQVTPDETLLLQSVGFRVYGPRTDKGPAIAGVRQGLVPNLSLDVINRDPGTYVVQVYNYDPVRPVPFQLWMTAKPAGAG
jgi:hypothetical protein